MTKKMNSNFDMAEGLNLLNKIERAVLFGQPVTNWAWLGEYNAWQAYRGRMFMGDIKRFITRPTTVSASSSGFSAKVKDFIGYTFAFIWSFALLMKWLVKSPQVIIYSIDKDSSPRAHNDQRVDLLYQTVLEQKINYSEFWHSFLGKSLFKNALIRGRFGLYMLIINVIAGWQYRPIKILATDFGDSLNHLTGEEKEFAITLLSNFYNQLAQSEIKIKLLAKILRFSKTKAIWAIDNTRDYQELVVAGKCAKVPFYAFQHGHFTKYHLGWLSNQAWPHRMAIPDRLFVWSDYWKNELVRLGSAFPFDQIVVGGVKKGNVIDDKLTQKINDPHQLGVLIPFETEGETTKIKQYIDELLKDESFTIYFKLRPDVSKEEQLAQYSSTANYHPRFVSITKTEEVLNKIDVVAGTYSTFLYDMIAFYKPIVLLKTTSDFGEGLVVNGLATMLDLDNSLGEKIKQAAQTPLVELEARLVKLNGEQPKYLADTLTILAKELITK